MQLISSTWHELNAAKRRELFFLLPKTEAEELFLGLRPREQVEILSELPLQEKRSWLRFIPPDDAADFIQNLPLAERHGAVSLLDEHSKREVMGLLAYAEDEAGGLMNPEYLRIRPDMTTEEAIKYLRAQAKTRVEAIYYAYVLDEGQKLLGVVSLREMLLATPEKPISEIMRKDMISIPEAMNQEDVALLFSNNRDLIALPVLDATGRMKGIVTHDDIATVIQIEISEDIQKIGGMEALKMSYFRTGFFSMIQKRAGWLTALFIGEMFTASAMGHYEHEIEKAVILALFIPLIISSGGNSGSQASSLIIRSLALREISLRDWWRVLYREIGSGLVLGSILGVIGIMRITVFQQWMPMYGEHYFLVAFTVGFSLVGVVLWGTITGSMLPFLLRRLGFDPASSSAPLVATLVDVTGLIIYFSVASIILRGTLL